MIGTWLAQPFPDIALAGVVVLDVVGCGDVQVTDPFEELLIVAAAKIQDGGRIAEVGGPGQRVKASAAEQSAGANRRRIEPEAEGLSHIAEIDGLAHQVTQLFEARCKILAEPRSAP